MSDFQGVAERVLRRCSERGLTIATAESCTAGCLATLLSDTPHANTHFHGGFVVYSKEQKTRVLGVEVETIARHTAVSEPVAKAMAAGILSACTADIGIAITGVAGPEPDDDGNPVGLMHVAVASRNGGVHHRRCDFGHETRGSLRVHAIKIALDLVEDVVGDFPSRSSEAE